jgi:hypothetical protein
MRLANFKDRSRLLGKHYISQSVTTTISSIDLVASTFGTRSSAYANLFARWRIVRILLSPVLSASSSSTTPVAVGFLDDTHLTGDAPTTLDDVVQLRCSAIFSSSSTVETDIEFRPVDPKTWYYTENESTASDARLYIPSSLWFLSSGSSSTVGFLMSYELEFEGAVSNV